MNKNKEEKTQRGGEKPSARRSCSVTRADTPSVHTTPKEDPGDAPRVRAQRPPSRSARCHKAGVIPGHTPSPFCSARTERGCAGRPRGSRSAEGRQRPPPTRFPRPFPSPPSGTDRTPGPRHPAAPPEASAPPGGGRGPGPGDGARGPGTPPPSPPPGPHPVLQLGRELALELAARAAAVVALDEHLARHRRLLRPHRAARSEPPPAAPRPAPPGAACRKGPAGGGTRAEVPRRARAAPSPAPGSGSAQALGRLAGPLRVRAHRPRPIGCVAITAPAPSPHPGCRPAPQVVAPPRYRRHAPWPHSPAPLCHSPAHCAITPPPNAIAPPPAAVSPRRVLPPAGGSERGSPSAAAAPVPVAGGGGRCLSPASCTATQQGSHARRDG